VKQLQTREATVKQHEPPNLQRTN